MTAAATSSAPAALPPAGHKEGARHPNPYRIQSHGLFLVVTEPGLLIRKLSLNVATLLALPPDRIVGRPLSDFLPSEPVSRLLENLTRHDSARPRFAGIVTLRDRPYSLLVHRTTLSNQPHVALEFEPACPAAEATPAFQNLYTIVSTAASSLQETPCAADACALAAQEVRRLTGFDRVMIYRFDADGNGQVVAEEKHPDAAVASCLDLWFPAADIPTQARDLHLCNPGRLIADVDDTPVDLFPAADAPDASPSSSPDALEMSQCTLHAASPAHVEYLKNINVGSSMSVSIIAQGKLWGLIACHHRTPAVVSIVLRTAEEMALLAEELQRSNRELELFSYSVSHDLRAPFRHIQGFTELLRYRRGDTPDPVTKSHLDTISKSAEHAGALVDALLALSHLGRTDLRRLDLDMHALALEAIQSVQDDTGRRRIPVNRITWSVDDLPRTNADPMLLRTVWRNLISNAAKYSGRRPAPHITVGATPGPAETTYFVKDNGAGFDMRYVHKLFGVFQRLHLSEEFEGTGIGLANVRRIVERHGGRVWAEGVPDQGATFCFSLPHTKEEGNQETDHG